MAMIQMSIVWILLVLMLLLILLLFLLTCKPWRFLSRLLSSRHSPLKVGDLQQRPLLSDDGNVAREDNSELTREYDLEGACYQNEGLLRFSRSEGRVYKQRPPSSSPLLAQGDSLVLEVISEPSEDISVGKTLKLTVEKGQQQDDQIQKLERDAENDRAKDLSPKSIKDQRSCLSLEVISGHSIGLQCSVHCTSTSKLPLTLGRVSPSDLLLKDSEVSGKHAQINWNSNKLKWELVDMGSLNGTFLNSWSVNHPDSGSRNWGEPVELTNGDIITLGTTTKVYVRISSQNEYQIPFKVGVASDPMALRRGGKKLPMEDVCYYQWPLPGIDKFGLFGVCDGHGGPEAAQSASRIFPEMLTNILSDTVKREKVLSECDASDVLRDAFAETEACLDHHYEGCAATVLLVWSDGEENFFAQCANVGDSACVINLDGEYVKMTEDHRVTSVSERMRIREMGAPLKDGETRICGLNLARMLGDKFLKQQESRFSSEPYISEVVHIDRGRGAFAVLASDGLWDVVSVKKAVQLVLEIRERMKEEGDTRRQNSEERIATGLLCEARTLRTKDNTSIIFLDFNSS